jgi:hypothetical protein
MKRILVCSVVALGMVAGCLFGVPRLSAQELPRAEDILDKATVATGGKAALQKVKTLVVRGKVSVQGMQGRFAHYLAAPDKSYEELTIDGLLTVQGGVRGQLAWEKNSITGSRVLQGTERAKAVREANLQAQADWRTHIKQAQVVGEEKVEGKPAYKLRLTTRDGEVVITHYDKQTGLAVRQEVTVESPQGKMNMVAFLSDHREVDGIVHPFTTRVVVGPAEIVMTAERVEHNVNIPEERFAVPADISRLAERQKAK